MSRHRLRLSSSNIPSIPFRITCNVNADLEATVNKNIEFMRGVAEECQGEGIDGEPKLYQSSERNEAVDQFDTVRNPLQRELASH